VPKNQNFFQKTSLKQGETGKIYFEFERYSAGKRTPGRVI
jgi:hypothetical protein